MTTLYNGDPANITTPAVRGISDASNTTPIVITTASNHTFGDNDSVVVAGVVGNTAANGAWKITKLGVDTFSLDGSVGNGAYVADAGDTVTDYSLTPEIVRPAGSDVRTAASINASIDALADRSQFLAARSTLRTDAFTATGTWTCPAGVTSVDVEAFGGGGGGGGASPAATGGATANGATGGGGGGGAQRGRRRLTVVPTTTYTITVGAGGTSGAASNPGGPGGDSSFGALATFSGAGGGTGTADTAVATAYAAPGGLPVRDFDADWTADLISWTYPSQVMLHAPGGGGAGMNLFSNANAHDGNGSIEGYAGGAGALLGTAAGLVAPGGGGGGGGGGPAGVGAAGGAGGDGAAGVAPPGVAGSSAAANTGAGGGGGGGGGSGGTMGAAGIGGVGGSGQVLITYFGTQAVIA